VSDVQPSYALGLYGIHFEGTNSMFIMQRLHEMYSMLYNRKYYQISYVTASFNN